MRIILVTHFFPPARNAGTETYTMGLAQNLAARGHSVQVVCAGDWQTGKEYWNGIDKQSMAGVTVNRINLNWHRARRPNRIIYDSQVVEDWFDEFLVESDADVVHITSVMSLGVGVLRSASRLGVPVILTLMDFWFLCPRTILVTGTGELCEGKTTAQECQRCLLRMSNLHNRLESPLLRNLQLAVWSYAGEMPLFGRLSGVRGIAPNMKTRKEMMQKSLKLPNLVLSHSAFVQGMFAKAGLSDSVMHLPNGHELNWMANYAGKSASPVVRFGYMGQLTHAKGLHTLIEAYVRAGIHTKSRLDIYGDLTMDTDYVSEIRNLASDSSSINFCGRFDRVQLPKILEEIDVLVVPSLWYENAPLVIQEAFATKTPVIATNLGGMAEAVTHDRNGLLFERGNEDDLASQLSRIVFEPELLVRLRAGIAPVKTIDDEVDELEKIYGELISGQQELNLP